jgi:hypothetical protein
MKPRGLLYFPFSDARFPWWDVPDVVIPVFALLFRFGLLLCTKVYKLMYVNIANALLFRL